MCKAEGRVKSYGVFCNPTLCMCKTEGRVQSYGVYACARQRIELSLMECFVTPHYECARQRVELSLMECFVPHSMHVQGRG